MESPMMVNMGSTTERIWMVHTTVHEVAHTYFPFYMGINERKYAWMDEGWTQMLSEYINMNLIKPSISGQGMLSVTLIIPVNLMRFR